MTSLGVTQRDNGVDVAVFSRHADAIEFCTFDADGAELGRFRLSGRTGDVFHDFIPGITEGTRYGLRAHGPFAPWHGHRFNASKLLLDPYAARLDRAFSLHPSMFDTGAQPSSSDSAPFMPKGLTGAPARAPLAPPVDWARLVIYEMHVRGFSMLNTAIPEQDRGTFAGLAHPASIDYLRELGVTAVELLPCAGWVDERHLPPLGLSNYWGYNPIAFGAPDPRLAPGGFADIAAAVAALRDAGIDTILDVVFNHSGESDEFGPTLSMRGLDNATYYRLRPDNPALYVNDAGCGNVLATERPGVVTLVMDVLRRWVEATGAAGFRFDLATTLGRREFGFDAAAPLLSAIAQDPLLRDRVLIAEPWDIGPGGYQLGSFGAPWAEWNDRFRDTARRFWRGDTGMIGDLATRLAGSADVFAPSHRPPSRSINYITAHDGFTLRDLVSYSQKNNAANGENNRDGTNDNLSWNNGAEGPAPDLTVTAARAADARALLATLLLSRGTPMLTMGDECGRTQSGNNNAYAQNNELSWLHWSEMDRPLLAAARKLISLRRATPALHEDAMLTGLPDEHSNLPDVVWLRPDGTPMESSDWQNPGASTLIAMFSAPRGRALIVLHAGRDAGTLTMPPPQRNMRWEFGFDSFAPEHDGVVGEALTFAPRCVVLLLEAAVPDSAKKTGVSSTTLELLAVQAGLSLDWWDVEGGLHKVAEPTLQSLLGALNLPASSEAVARESLGRLAERRDLRALPLALTLEADQPGVLALGPSASGRDRWLIIEPEAGPTLRINIAAGDGSPSLRVAADGRRFTSRAVELPKLPAGRYEARLEGLPGVTRLTVAPAKCYLPPSLAEGGRRWGISAHLYALRHDSDQGIGDFTALSELASVAGRQNAALLGLNPLHALFRQDRDRASPYHPSDRRFLDPIYVDVAAIGRIGEAPGVRAALAAEAGTMAQLRAAKNVDYTSVWRVKERVLRAAFDALPKFPDEVSALDEFISLGGDALRDFTLWENLVASQGGEWRAWPAGLTAPDGKGVEAFAAAHADEIRFSAFLQFLAESALRAAADAAKTAGMEIGLYRDLAVGCAPDGAEAWSEQARLLTGASVGAPPDPIGPLGQVWHLPPPDPLAMAEDGYRSFANLLDVNMRHAGALRIDHVMGLTRLFVIPAGGAAADGAYLSYQLRDMLGQVKLASQRAKCLVVGEDLGTVPQAFGAALAEAHVLSYRVLWFERDGETFREPSSWPALAASCVSTHDLPTLAGWWQGDDIAEEAALGRIDEVTAAAQRAARQTAKTQLLDMLRAEGLFSGGEAAGPPLAAIHALIARTPAALALVQADDLAGERIALNLPGTDRERPNWRRRISATAPELADNEIIPAIRQERP